MSGVGGGGRLSHPALEPAPGTPLETARLTDRQRLGVVLQAAALLSHLDNVGWRMADGWRQATVAAGGLLRGVEAERGRPREMAQESLVRLLRRLFPGGREVPGRGQARRAARRLLADWTQTLRPVPPDRTVAQVLEASPFLWLPAFGDARRALSGGYSDSDGARPWVAGPGRFRRRVLAAGGDAEGVEAVLAGDEARAFWAAAPAAKPPAELAKRGRWRAAVEAWRRQPPQSAGERLALAHALYSLARFAEARRELKGLRTQFARVVRVACLSQVGELGAARRALRRLETDDLEPCRLLEAAEIAVRVYGNLGQAESARRWVERALAVRNPKLAARAEVLAAVAAWDRREPRAMERHLERAAPALADPEVAWRWHHARALAAMQAGDGAAVSEQIVAALAGHRRRLRHFEAGALWNDLAIGRALAGDLAGAERAFLHTHRLLGDSQGSRKTTLALFNLAEIRLRRGRLLGVREILERTTAENLASGNYRAQVQDAELWARFELVLGRPAAALTRVDQALELLDRRRIDWHRDVLSLFAARALGWMDRAPEALARLAATEPETWGEIEPEERPAVWALAGDRERALAAAEGPLAELWRALLAGGAGAGPAAWEALRSLEPYRAARFVLDAELVEPGSAPPTWTRRAARTLRRLGAERLAERLEAHETGPWRAIERFLTGAEEGAGRVARLFVEAGYQDVDLRWSDGETAETLVEGEGGPEELSAAVDGGRLVLRAPYLDRPLRSLFALAAREVRPGAAGGAAETEVEAATVDGIVGESKKLREALHRLGRLATRDVPILIYGETGTGKELAARRVHALSPRAAAPLVAINCAEMADSLLASELFGHVRGAFTGADRDRAGVFEAARGGTVFLDEIGDLELPAQGKLLRVLQEGEVRRVGESLPRRVDVRVVAATHRDLGKMVEEGSFRRDLFYRLKVGSVTLPPLRERGQDVPLLARHFINRAGGGKHRLSARARARLRSHDWPGNVRELQSVLEVAVALAEGRTIRSEHLDLPYRASEPRVGYHQKVEDYRRGLIEKALAASGGNRSEAARRLGLSRQALSYLVKSLGITT